VLLLLFINFIDVVACDNFFAHRHLSLNLVPFNPDTHELVVDSWVPGFPIKAGIGGVLGWT
jgi:hypothetical protein